MREPKKPVTLGSGNATPDYLTQLEQKRQDAYDAAAAERERAVADADSAYKHNLSEYGARAERLASMGLTGSGYSEHLNSQAYATMRGEVQKAHAAETAAKEAADTTYYSDVLAKQETDNNNYLSLLRDIKNGNLSASEVKELSGKFGFGGEDTSSLIAQAQEYTFNSYMNKLLNPDPNSSETFDISEIDSDHSVGNLSSPQYEELKKLWNSEAKNIVGSFDGFSLTKDEAQSTLDYYRENSWASPELIASLEEKFKEVYTPVRMGVHNDNGGYNEIVNLGEDFQVKDENGTQYWVMSTGVVDRTGNTNLYQIAEDVEEGELFGYDGQMYLRYGGNVYGLTSTGDGWEYSQLYDKIFSGKKPIRSKAWDERNYESFGAYMDSLYGTINGQLRN